MPDENVKMKEEERTSNPLIDLDDAIEKVRNSRIIEERHIKRLEDGLRGSDHTLEEKKLIQVLLNTALKKHSEFLEEENLHKRALADYQNLQREFTKEREKMRTRALQDVVEQLLPILDNFQAALQHSPSRSAEGASGTPDKNIESWVKGVEMIKKQMEDLLTDFGVKKIETVGKPFDPSCMEAVGEEESNVKGQKSNVVSRETLAGYRLGDTVIRAAKVILAAGK